MAYLLTSYAKDIAQNRALWMTPQFKHVPGILESSDIHVAKCWSIFNDEWSSLSF